MSDGVSKSCMIHIAMAIHHCWGRDLGVVTQHAREKIWLALLFLDTNAVSIIQATIAHTVGMGVTDPSVRRAYLEKLLWWSSLIFATKIRLELSGQKSPFLPDLDV
jgi:hypothetical protein